MLLLLMKKKGGNDDDDDDDAIDDDSDKALILSSQMAVLAEQASLSSEDTEEIINLEFPLGTVCQGLVHLPCSVPQTDCVCVFFLGRF